MKEQWKVFIRGVEGRGSEVIKVLTDLGGTNEFLYGTNEDLLYFIKHDGIIDNVYLSSETAKIIMDSYREIKLDEKWKPKEKQAYWYVDIGGHLANDLFDDSIFDNDMYNFGDCFKTEEEAEIAAKKIKHLLKGE